ncbi:MAG TPA: hypothetical protein DCZ72_14080 [Armatimonadetes bacterium]|nr:hypothetical protein [Armatimonadota bacterium]
MSLDHAQLLTPAERYAAIYPLFTAGLDLAPDEVISVRAPMRWMLSGWRDVPTAGGGDCTNIALTAGASTSLRRGTRPDRLVLQAPDVDLHLNLSAADLARLPDPRDDHAIIRALLHAAQPPVGLELRCTAKGIPAATGLGTSAAVLVTLVQALAVAAGRDLTPLELVHAARLPETHLLGLSCGYQDQAAAVHGGVANYHTRFEGDREALEMRELAVDDALLATLDLGMIIVDFGRPHSSHRSHEVVFERLAERHPDSIEAFDLLAAAEAGVQAALAAGDFDAFCESLDLTWQAQHLLAPNMVLPVMRDVVAMARGLGVRAANVNGAGMGGTVTLLCEPDAVGWVVRALDRLRGVRVLPCDISHRGTFHWRHRARGV